jgi:rhomboid protease GluP
VNDPTPHDDDVAAVGRGDVDPRASGDHARGDASAEPGPLSAALPPTTIALRRRPARRGVTSALVFLLLGIAPATLLPLVWFVSTRALSMTTALVLVGAGLLASLGWLVSLFWLPAAAPIVVDDDGVRFPWGRGETRVALDEIVVARVQGRELLWIAGVPRGARATGDVGAWQLPGRVFFDVDGPQRVVDAITAHLHRHADGARLLTRLVDNAERQLRFNAVRPVVTWVVVGVCVAVFVGQAIAGAVVDVDAILRWGANSGALVRQGEVWRVVTACLLHGSVVHLVMNATSLWPVGAVVERWVGRPAMIVVLFVSGAGGHLASALVGRAPVSVGVSGAVFGLLGVLFVSSIRFRGQTTGGLKVRLSSWLFLLFANALLSTLPFIDVVAHGAGFVAGAVVGVVASPRPGRAVILPARTLRALAGACVVLTILALVAAGRAATA